MKRKITSHFSHNTVSHNYTYASKVQVNCVEIIYYNIYWLFNMRKQSPNLGINTINTNITFPKFVLIVLVSLCYVSKYRVSSSRYSSYFLEVIRLYFILPQSVCLELQTYIHHSYQAHRNIVQRPQTIAHMT